MKNRLTLKSLQIIFVIRPILSFLGHWGPEISLFFLSDPSPIIAVPFQSVTPSFLVVKFDLLVLSKLLHRFLGNLDLSNMIQGFSKLLLRFIKFDIWIFLS